MAEERYMTVVYCIKDEESFAEEKKKIMDKMLLEGEAPWKVTAVSLDDEITRLDFIQKVIDNSIDFFMISEILEINGINKYADFDDFISDID